MNLLAPAVHRAIVCVDVEGFGDRRRTHSHQVAVRNGLYRCLHTAFVNSGIGWQDTYHEDRGDGALILVPPEVPKNLLAASVPGELASALADHNQTHDRRSRIRLRLALHAGEIHHDEHGVTGTAINVAFRLLEAAPLKQALAGSRGTLALIVSEWFFEEVIRHTPDSAPATYRRVRIAVKETTATAWICLPDDPYPPQDDAPLLPVPIVAVPRQLPSVTSSFAGRFAELRGLTNLIDEATETGTAVISAIGGTAGIGKTVLAVHWAHQVADRFPDGQLYVDLRGFDPTRSPMAPAEAMRGFLDAFEVAAERIPVSLDAQAALYRSLLAGRRVLVVLDNARDADQVRPLLPGTAGCVAVVTSRHRLTSLITAEGARPMTLGLFTVAEARQMLAHRLGTGPMTAEPQAADDIIALCARLPLALSIVAARASAHPQFSLAALVSELRDTGTSLEALDGGDQATDIRAVFSWSYQQLSTEAARMFRLLGPHPGPDIATSAAASLTALPLRRVRSALAELARAHLVTEHVPGRFTFHDLLRIYATEQAHAHDSEIEQHTALHRILDHYLHTAQSAALLLHPGRCLHTVAPPKPGVIPQEFADYAAAWTWLTAEYPVLLAAIHLAADTGFDTHAWQLPWAVQSYFRRQGHWHDWDLAYRTALTAAQHSDDRRGQGHAHQGLGRLCILLERYEAAHTHLQKALDLFEELADQAGQAAVHGSLAVVLDNHQGRRDLALLHARQALDLSRAAGYRRGQATALHDIGWYHALLGDHHQTLTQCQQALAICRELGNRLGEAHVLNTLGHAYHHLGRHEQATTCFKQSLTLQRELGDRFGQAMALSHLGDTYHATDNPAAARDAWQQALEILDQLGISSLGNGYRDADQIRTQIHHLAISDT